MRRSGQKLPAITLFGQSEENTDFEPNPKNTVTGEPKNSNVLRAEKAQLFVYRNLFICSGLFVFTVTWRFHGGI
jgi:hypothetical protein